jgi:hypothetical protein
MNKLPDLSTKQEIKRINSAFSKEPYLRTKPIVTIDDFASECNEAPILKIPFIDEPLRIVYNGKLKEIVFLDQKDWLRAAQINPSTREYAFITCYDRFVQNLIGRVLGNLGYKCQIYL